MITIEEAIARISLWRDAAVSAAPVAGGITNRNYRVEVNGDIFVLQIAGQGSELLGIDRHRTYQCTLAAAQTGVGPEVVRYLPADGILVTRFVFGRRITGGEAARPEILARVVHALRRYHAGPAFPGLFSPFRTLEAYLRVARAAGAPLPEDIGWMYDRIAAIETAVGPGESSPRPCHNDLWASNLIDDGAGIRIIDWEYAGMGDVYFDLANVAIHNTFSDAQDEALLRTYFGAIVDAGIARLRLLKIVAELREAMWAVAAQNLAATAASGFDSLGYARTHFDRCREALGDRRLSGWLCPPAAG